MVIKIPLKNKKLTEFTGKLFYVFKLFLNYSNKVNGFSRYVFSVCKN